MNLSFIKKALLLLILLIPIQSYAKNYTDDESCENLLFMTMKARVYDLGLEKIIIPNNDKNATRMVKKYLNEARKIKTHPVNSEGHMGSKNMMIIEKFISQHKASCMRELVQIKKQEEKEYALAQQRNQPKSGGGVQDISLLFEREESVGFLDHRKFWQKTYAVYCKNGGGAVIKNEVSGSNMEIVKYCIQPNASYLMDKLGCHSDLNGFNEAARYVCQ